MEEQEMIIVKADNFSEPVPFTFKNMAEYKAAHNAMVFAGLSVDSPVLMGIAQQMRDQAK